MSADAIRITSEATGTKTEAEVMALYVPDVGGDAIRITSEATGTKTEAEVSIRCTAHVSLT